MDQAEDVVTATRLRFNENRRDWLRSARAGHPLAYIIRALPEAIARSFPALHLSPGDRLLDFGCADQPYRGLLPSGVVYVGADIAGNPSADVELTEAGGLPLDDASFDAVLSTQVLEHVLDPRVYVSECFRVLRPGGRLLLSTHGTMVLHRDPIDLWRWTSDGLRVQLERSGLEIVAFEGVMGLAATGLQLFQDATLGRVPRWARRPYASLLQAAIAFWDRSESDRARALNALVYVVVAEKPRG